MRAQALAKLGLVELVEPEALTPDKLAERLNLVLEKPRPSEQSSMDLGGLARIADELIAMAGR